MRRKEGGFNNHCGVHGSFQQEGHNNFRQLYKGGRGTYNYISEKRQGRTMATNAKDEGNDNHELASSTTSQRTTPLPLVRLATP
eukprot:5488810-Amphidinium_carterae.1